MPNMRDEEAEAIIKESHNTPPEVYLSSDPDRDAFERDKISTIVLSVFDDRQKNGSDRGLQIKVMSKNGFDGQNAARKRAQALFEDIRNGVCKSPAGEKKENFAVLLRLGSGNLGIIAANGEPEVDKKIFERHKKLQSKYMPRDQDYVAIEED